MRSVKKSLLSELGFRQCWELSICRNYICRLKENFPEVDFRLFEFGSIKACDLVLEEKLDIAIVNAEQPSIDKCNSRIIDTEDLLFCVSSDHPLATNRKRFFSPCLPTSH